ncbi:MAG: DUF2723 domain-containing protein [Merismopedia sp. SIO2A8]|nr:DUF2723 domain-containing protein [Merismopedia sp. SIO2A8]
MRLPFQAQLVQSWDAGNFALAVEHYDVRLEQPHMPGTFIIFVFLARFFNLFFKNPTASLVMVNVLASAIAAAMLYVIAATWFNPRAGKTAALLMLTSPLVWFYGEMPLSYMAEFCWVLLIVFAAYCTGLGKQKKPKDPGSRAQGIYTNADSPSLLPSQFSPLTNNQKNLGVDGNEQSTINHQPPLGDKKALFALALLMGLSGGIRPGTPFFLLPLSLLAVWRGLHNRQFNLKHVAAAVLVGLVGLAIWMIPLLIISGGPQAYWQLVEGWIPVHTQRQDADTLLEVLDNLLFFLKTVLMGVGVAVFPALWVLIGSGVRIIRNLRRDWRLQTVLLWIAPGMMFFLFVHMRRQGHSFTIMPAFILLSGLAVVWLCDRFALALWANRLWRWCYRANRFSKQGNRAWVVLTIAIALINGTFFLFGPNLRTFTTISKFDAKYGERIEFVRANFPPATTAIVAQKHYGRLPDVHLSEYQEPHLSRRVEDIPIVIAPQVRTLVLLDNKIFRQPGQDSGFQKLEMPSGKTIRYRSWSPDWQLKVTKYTSELVPVSSSESK